MMMMMLLFLFGLVFFLKRFCLWVFLYFVGWFRGFLFFFGVFKKKIGEGGVALGFKMYLFCMCACLCFQL